MDSKWLANLNPAFKTKVLAFERALIAKGLHADPTQAYRSITTQNALYAQGRTKPGQRVTNARGGQSAHNYGAAMDFVPVLQGKRTYDVPSTWWNEFGAVAKSCGLTWGGSWKTIKDRPHVELPGWEKLRSH